MPLATLQVRTKRSRSARNSGDCDRDGVPLRERVGEAVLAQVAADRDLAAEGVAAALEVEMGDVVRIGLDEDGHVQTGQPHRVGDTLLVAEVGQHDDDALDARPGPG